MWLLPWVISGAPAPYWPVGRRRMRIRGMPATGRSWRRTMTGR